MPEERAFFEAYKSLPKSRAQEFLRRCVMIGFLSRKKPRHGFYEPSMETRLKSINDSDMISKVSTTANDKPHQGAPRRQEAQRKEGFLAHMEDHAGPVEGYVFHDDFEEGSLPAAPKARLSAAPESHPAPTPAQVAPVDARDTGWKRPKLPVGASVAPNALPTPPETPVSRVRGKVDTAGQVATRTSDASHRLLEERIFQSLESKNEERSDEGRASGSGQAGSQTAGGSAAGSGDANLLKGFFGE